MKKILKLLTLLLVTNAFMLINANNLNAASATAKVTTNKYTALIGSEVKVTVRVSSGSPLGAWEYTLGYDSSKLKLLSETNHIVKYASGSNVTSATETFTFKVIGKGTSTVSIKSINVLGFDEAKMSVTPGSTSIKGITEEELIASYSKNNNLKSLKVDGYELNEKFNKETLNYTVNVPSDVEKINISGLVEDNTASVNGLGEFSVTEGKNTFEIKVTAQNGSAKTYIVDVNVMDLNPIEVTINNKKYTVIKRASVLEAPQAYEISTTTINGIEVPSFTSSITSFVLVGLKSPEGTNQLYIYDETDGSYTEYKEIKTNGITLYPKEINKTLDLFNKKEITLNNVKINAFQYKENNEFYVIYGINIETGEEGFYQYDVKNNSIVRYDETIINDLNKKIENYFTIIIVLGVETILLLIIVVIKTINKKKRKKKIKKLMIEKLEKEANTKKE